MLGTLGTTSIFSSPNSRRGITCLFINKDETSVGVILSETGSYGAADSRLRLKLSHRTAHIFFSRTSPAVFSSTFGTNELVHYLFRIMNNATATKICFGRINFHNILHSFLERSHHRKAYRHETDGPSLLSWTVEICLTRIFIWSLFYDCKNTDMKYIRSLIYFIPNHVNALCRNRSAVTSY